MVEVLGTTEFGEWFLGLGSTDAQAVARGVGILEAKGLALGFPYSSALGGAGTLCASCGSRARDGHRGSSMPSIPGVRPS
jgi:hypothetical protein